MLAPHPDEALVAPATGRKQRRRPTKRSHRGQIFTQDSPNSHAGGRLLQDQEATGAVKAEMSVGIWTLGEMGPDGSGHKLCRVLEKGSVRSHILGLKVVGDVKPLVRRDSSAGNLSLHQGPQRAATAAALLGNHCFQGLPRPPQQRLQTNPRQPTLGPWTGEDVPLGSVN